jgi:SAM-dependent methyltransferase
MKKFFEKIHRKIFPGIAYYLDKELVSCKSVLDLGCGPNSPIRYLSKRFYSIGIDAFGPSIEQSKKNKIHDKYYLMNVLDIDKKFKAKSFDAVIALDLIEHLTKREGLSLLKKMEQIARKKVIIFTPNGFLPQKEYGNNPWQIHKSGWTVKEMRKKGYRIIRINGLKCLRKEKAEIRYKPKFFWRIISDITQIFVKNKPERAFQILCVKEIK